MCAYMPMHRHMYIAIIVNENYINCLCKTPLYYSGCCQCLLISVCIGGNSGTNDFNIEVDLQIGSVPLARDVVVTVSTEDGTARGRLAQWGGG